MIARILLACTFLVLSQPAYSESITFNMAVPPGGGIDNAVTSLVPSLRRSGFEVKKQFLKSCTEVFDAQRKSPINSIMVLDIGSVIFSDHTKGSLCPPVTTLGGDVEVISSLYSTPVLLCTSPGVDLTDLSKMKSHSASKKIKVGSSAPLFTNVLLTSMIGSDVNVVVLPYAGGGQLKPAIVAKDVDMFVNGSLPSFFEPMGSVCVATSNDTVRKLPTFSKFFNHSKSLPLVDFSTLMISQAGAVSVNAKDALNISLQSEEFKKALTIMNVRHDGIGIGVTSADLYEQLIQIEKSYILPYLK